MVATSPAAAIKQSRIKIVSYTISSLADALTNSFIVGSVTASTSPILGFKGRLSMIQMSVPVGSTGTLTAKVYILPGAGTPGSTTLAMTKSITPSALYGSETAASTATNGAEIDSTDRLAISVTTASLGGATALLNATFTLTFEADD